MAFRQRRVIEVVGRVAAHPDPLHHRPRPHVADRGERHDLVQPDVPEADGERAPRRLGRVPVAPRLAHEPRDARGPRRRQVERLAAGSPACSDDEESLAGDDDRGRDERGQGVHRGPGLGAALGGRHQAQVTRRGGHRIGPAEGTLTLEADVVPRSELLLRFPDERIPEVWPSYVRIRIADTGSGMDKETLQRIFEPFFTTKKTGEGTGLGLALAEQIIHTHRGQICAESTLGKGSTFFIYLPVLEQEREREQLQWGQNSNLRILAVDDNQKVLSMLEKELSRLGLDVSTCARRGDVRTLLDSQPFDVLAIDESVTEGSGVDFCMSIQGRFPGMTRIVMASALTRELINAKSHGVMDGYILKPVAASTLLEEIRACRKK